VAHAQPEIADPAWLRKELLATIHEHDIPAMSVAVVVDGQVVAASAVGERKVGSGVPVQRDDGFMLCSVSKSLTATMIARLVDDGAMSWDMTLPQMFPGMVHEMRPAYRKVTLLQLLAHVSGIGYHSRPSERELARLAPTLIERRRLFVRDILEERPQAPPGTRYMYGTGPTVAASAAERVTGDSYERLMHWLLFKPLHMITARFGPMSRPHQITGIWEHRMESGRPVAVPPDPELRHQVRSPVGRNLHCSAIDLARFAAVHLQGARGQSNFLKPDTFRTLHTIVHPAKHAAPGFFISQRKGFRGPIISHTGGNGQSLSIFMIAPEENVAAVVLLNVSSRETSRVCHRWCVRLLELARNGRFTGN